MSAGIKVSVAAGKYTFVHSLPVVDVLRYGEPWLQIGPGINAIYALMCELDAARVVLAAARDLGDDAPIEIKAALRRHMALVDDRNRPSAWSSPWECDQ